MAYVVAEPCIDCKYTDCVEVCPVDCFYEGANFLVIHPEECIDCGACEPACPTKAIFPEESLPAKWSEYVQLNADLAEEVAEHHREEGRAARGGAVQGRRGQAEDAGDVAARCTPLGLGRGLVHGSRLLRPEPGLARNPSASPRWWNW